MTALSHNHAGFQLRLDYIQQLLDGSLGFSAEVSDATQVRLVGRA